MTSSFQNTIILKRPGVGNLADIIKVIARFIKKSSKTQEKLIELGIIYQNPIYISISFHDKIC